MFERLQEGWQAFRQSSVLFGKYPRLILPFVVAVALNLVVAAALIAAGVVQARAQVAVTPGTCIVLSLILFFISSIMLALGACTVLELIEQHESGQPMNLRQAAVATLGYLPAVLVVGSVWFVARVIIDMLFGRRRQGGSDTGEELAEKVARMAVFMVLPAIAWEGLGPIAAIRRGLGIARKHLVEMGTGFGLSLAATYLLSLVFISVPVIGYKMLHPGPVAGAALFAIMAYVIIVLLLITAYTCYLEQVFCATIYLWHLKWERAAKAAAVQGGPEPRLADVPQPSLTDDVAELVVSRAG